MSSHVAPTAPPLAWFGHRALGIVAYLGGLAILAAAAARSIARPIGPAPPFRPAVARQCAWMLGMGVPLVALVHVGIGSFLAMQAFYGATFVEGVGPVVGVGLFRNVAPLLAGMTLAGLLATRTTSELRNRPHADLDDDPSWVPDREIVLGRQPDPRTPPEPARLAAVRLTAAVLVGPILVLTGAVVGTLIGILVAQSFMDVPAPIFLGKFFEMFWARDVVGVVVKGVAFALVSALFACHEGLRPRFAGPDATAMAAFRAACLSALAILLLNSAWFMLMYYAGPAFGPTVLNPPVH